MIIKHPRYPSCYGLEKRVTKLIQLFSLSLDNVDYLSVQWHLWCNAQQKGLNAFEFPINKSNYCMSFCSESEVLDYPTEVAALGVSHLFLSFSFNLDISTVFSQQGITLIYSPVLPQYANNDNNHYVLNVRAMGKKGKTLELSLLEASGIERIEAEDCRIVFTNKNEIERVEVDINNLRDNGEVKQLLDKSLIVLCRSDFTSQLEIILKAIESNVVPIIPNEDKNRLLHFPEYFQNVINHEVNKIYLTHIDSANVAGVIRAFNDNSNKLAYYTASESSIVKLLIEYAFNLSSLLTVELSNQW